MIRFALAALLVTTLLGHSPAAERLKVHGKPSPLPKGAATENWTRYLGPHHDATSRETKLLKTWPDGGLKPVWELERGDTTPRRRSPMAACLASTSPKGMSASSAATRRRVRCSGNSNIPLCTATATDSPAVRVPLQ